MTTIRMPAHSTARHFHLACCIVSRISKTRSSIGRQHPSGMIEIRPAAFTDMPVLRDLAIETQISTFGEANTHENMAEFIALNYNLPQLQKEWAEPGSIYTMAWEGDQAAGFYRLRLSEEVNHLLGKNS